MTPLRFKPLIDKLFFIVFVPTLSLTLAACIVPAFFSPTTLFVSLPVFLFVLYFVISPLFGYAELREDGLFIKYGLILKKHIPYENIRSAEKTRKFYSDSMLYLKNSFEHVNIKYNRFDVTAVSVKSNDEFVEKLLEAKAKKADQPETK